MLDTGVEDKTKILRELQEAAADCDSIAQVLKISNGKIEAIKKEKAKCKERLGEYVEEWLKGNGGDRTWEFLCGGLRDKLVGRKDIADKLQKQLL